MIETYRAVDSATADLYEFAAGIVRKHFSGHRLLGNSGVFDEDDLIQECMEGFLTADNSYKADGMSSLTTWRYIKGLQRIHHFLRTVENDSSHTYPDQQPLLEDGSNQWDYIVPLHEGLSSFPDELPEILKARAIKLLTPDDALFVLYHFGVMGSRPLTVRELQGYGPNITYQAIHLRIKAAIQRLSKDVVLRAYREFVDD